jgi:hypothetical protein
MVRPINTLTLDNTTYLTLRPPTGRFYVNTHAHPPVTQWTHPLGPAHQYAPPPLPPSSHSHSHNPYAAGHNTNPYSHQPEVRHLGTAHSGHAYTHRGRHSPDLHGHGHGHGHGKHRSKSRSRSRSSSRHGHKHGHGGHEYQHWEHHGRRSPSPEHFGHGKGAFLRFSLLKLVYVFMTLFNQKKEVWAVFLGSLRVVGSTSNMGTDTDTRMGMDMRRCTRRTTSNTGIRGTAVVADWAGWRSQVCTHGFTSTWY